MQSVSYAYCVIKYYKIYSVYVHARGFPGGSDGKESACSAGHWVWIPGLIRFPWRREWPPTPVFLPGEFHGQKILVGYTVHGVSKSQT